MTVSMYMVYNKLDDLLPFKSIDYTDLKSG